MSLTPSSRVTSTSGQQWLEPGAPWNSSTGHPVGRPPLGPGEPPPIVELEPAGTLGRAGRHRVSDPTIAVSRSLASHGEAVAFIGSDQVVEILGGFIEVDLDPVHATR